MRSADCPLSSFSEMFLGVPALTLEDSDWSSPSRGGTQKASLPGEPLVLHRGVLGVQAIDTPRKRRERGDLQ
jgi:hypothetical protein